jgi:two-component system OmpR family sensor kinase/two-component system sensor histidine kinase BaeS
MNRLWVRLALAFGLVTLVAVIVAALLANYQVSSDFRRYVFHNQMLESTLPPTLTDYYTSNGSWAGVESVLANIRGPGMGMGRGQGQGQGQGTGRGMGSPGFALADAAGQIIYSSTGERVGGYFNDAELTGAVTIAVQGQPVGYLAGASPGNQLALTAEAEAFLGQINQSLLQAGLIAGVLGVLLGAVIARGLSAPLGRLATAARSIAHGQLSQRVPVSGATELADLAVAFNEMAENLEQAETIRRNMVADVAHELRTPLSVVQGNLRAILDDVYPLEKEEIASIYDETLVLNRLISDLRELAQAEAGQLSLNLDECRLSPLVSGMADRFRELARENGISLSTNIPANLPAIQADEDRVRQVLHNFLSNALRHTPANGQITIAAKTLPDAVQVSVRDTGSGIAPDDLPHVFNRFYRADKARSREQGGSGLGLAIARQIIKSHGGQVGVTSEIGTGSRFWFTLPR